MLLIPAIDLRHGRCVRLLQGDFGAETRYEHEPHELLLRYRGLGASWLHIVDLDGAKEGVLANRSIIVALASQRAVRLQVGGGVNLMTSGSFGVRLGADYRRIFISDGGENEFRLVAGVVIPIGK